MIHVSMVMFFFFSMSFVSVVSDSTGRAIVRPGPGTPDSSMDLSNYFTNVHYFTNYST